MPFWSLQSSGGTHLLFIFHISFGLSLHPAGDESSVGTSQRGQEEKLSGNLSLS